MASLIKNVNARISRISEYVQPVTLKSPADKIEKFIHKKGTIYEGQFKSYSQYVKDNGYITKEEYESTIRDFIDEYESQLTVVGATRYAVNNFIESQGDYLDPSIDLYKVPKKELIKAINEAGAKADADMKAGKGTSDVFYVYLEELLQDYITDF